MRDYQIRSTEACSEVFGHENCTNQRERALRFFEEACELARAAGLDFADMKRMLHFEFGRPKGSLPQEVAGAMLTLLTLADANMVDAQTECEREIARILANKDKIREKMRRKPADVQAVA